MSLGTLSLKNLQQAAEIRAEKLLEIARSALWHQDPVGLHSLPVRQGRAEATWHSFKTFLQVGLLPLQGSFQDAFEDLFMTELQRLLHCLIGIKGSESSMLVSSCREIAQRGHVS